jgi:nitroreductase
MLSGEKIGTRRFSQPITDLIKARTSQRAYKSEAIHSAEKDTINSFIQAHRECPFGSKLRFKFISATAESNKALDDMGTYGFIDNPAGYIVGAVNAGPYSLEDFGYAPEGIVLKMTDLGIDSCWLGATFKVSEFTKKMDSVHGEVIPAAIALGYATGKKGPFERFVRWGAQAHKRLAWEKLFYNNDFSTPLSKDDAGDFATPLEMVRLGASASNRQPWKLVKENDSLWHLYLQRTDYYLGLMSILNRADIQRLDMGIAMFHFEAACEEVGIEGEWFIEKSVTIGALPKRTEYVASFRTK